MADRVGQQFGNYRLVRLLGQGGFAEVYLGEHLQLGTQAAIKLLHTHIASEDVEFFRKEARTIAHLVHPHIVRVFDFGVEGTIPFLVMDYATGGTVRKRYPRGVALPLPTIVTCVTQTADALQYAHDEHVIHRDIKPENLLLGRRQEVLLSDFGLAQLAQSSRSQSTQDVAGTATYMAPEQFQGKPRPASDQYALGVMVYEWLSGDRPFHGSFTEVASQHLFVPPPPLRGKVPTISAAIEQVVLTALAKDPKQRFDSVRAFATAFVQASQSALAAPSRDLPPVATLFTSAPTQRAPQADQALPPSHAKPSPSSSEPPALLTESLIPTEIVTPPSQSTIPTAVSEPPDLAESSGEVITPFNRVSQPTSKAETASPLLRQPPEKASSPSQASLLSRSEALRPRKQGISRRAVVVGLAGVAVIGVVGSGIAWLTHTQKSPVISTTASSTTTPRPTTTSRPTPTATPHPQLGTTLLTYSEGSGEVFAIAWSSDSKHIASGGSGGVKVWDAVTGKTISTYQGHSTSVDIAVPAVNAITWSPGGRLIASAGRDATVQLWDGTTGGHMLTYRGHSASQWVNGVSWSPDGTRIVSGSGDKTAQVWNAATGNTLLTYQGHANTRYGVQAVAWSPDNKRIASAGDDNVQVWDAAIGNLLSNSDAGAYGAYAVAWSPDGKRIAAGCADGTARVWDATTGNHIATYTGHQGGVVAVTWSSDSKRIASASADFDVQVWDAATGNHIYTYGPSDVVRAVAWSPNDTRIASADYGKVRVWQAV